MSESTREKLIAVATQLFAARGYDGVGMRQLAQQVGISQSVIYHYFGDKDVLLKYIFDRISRELGRERAQLPKVKGLRKQLEQRIRFQFEHAEAVVYILKYYLHFRPEFMRLSSGFVPDSAYKHIREVLEDAVTSNEIEMREIDTQAKVITHMINGFVLEYYPEPPTGRELKDLLNELSNFICRSLKSQGVSAQ